MTDHADHTRHDDAGALRARVLEQDHRDYQLWSIALLALLVLATGFAALFLPKLAWEHDVVELSGRYVPQLIYGLLSLIVLFNIYVIGQRRRLRDVRTAFLEQVIRAEKALAESFIDPLTGLFNRRYMDYLVLRETKRVDRGQGIFSLLMIDIDGFTGVNNQSGHLAGDRLLEEVACVLKETFRLSDTIIRYGGDEFLVLMPDTNRRGAVLAQRRLEQAVDTWNAGRRAADHRMALSCGVACYTYGLQIEHVLGLADERMYSNKKQRRSGAVLG